MFRHERPQKGRFRQFHQIDAEILGDAGPLSDAEIILLAVRLFERLHLPGLSLHINSLGCPRCRAGFREDLLNYLADRKDALCPDCRRRAETNPLRIFDCKVDTCKAVVTGAPAVLDSICEACRDHFEVLRGYLEDLGLSYVLNPMLVRGLDYYTRTTFEIQTDRLGAQNAVLGGGRYDGLVRQLGGPDHPAIGFAIGVERLVALLQEQGEEPREAPDLFIAALGERARKETLRRLATLRDAGLWVETDYGSRGLKAQMKRADRLAARRVLILGEDELAAAKAVLRDMQTKEQEDIPLDRLLPSLLDRISPQTE
jgi:histidyl-tRNA synthetase